MRETTDKSDSELLEEISNNITFLERYIQKQMMSDEYMHNTYVCESKVSILHEIIWIISYALIYSFVLNQ